MSGVSGVSGAWGVKYGVSLVLGGVSFIEQGVSRVSEEGVKVGWGVIVGWGVNVGWGVMGVRGVMGGKGGRGV